MKKEIKQLEIAINELHESNDISKAGHSTLKFALEQVKNITYEPVLQTVPYQLCPKCGGDGEVLVNNWNGSPTSISTGMQICDLCGGAKIIPQHIMPVEYKITK